MENDLILKHFLNKDQKLNKIEMKLSLEYLKCKIDKCYPKDKSTFIHEDYEECKLNCMKNLSKLKLMKEFIYKDFTQTYYGKFLDCSKEIEDSKYNTCLDNSKKMMTKNIEEIKKFLLNYKFS
jgi:hypothetical protein